MAFPGGPQDVGQLDGRIVPSAGTGRLRAKGGFQLPLWEGTKPAFVKHDSTTGGGGGDEDSLPWTGMGIVTRKQFELRALPGWQRHG